MDKLVNQPVSSLDGVGPAIASKLKKIGIESVWDLVHHYPRRYDDFSVITPIAKLKPGQVTIQGKIKRINSRRTFRRRFSITEALIDDGSGAVKAIWFNQPYLAKSLPKDTPIFAAGNLEFKHEQYALQNPVVEQISRFQKNTARIVPIYAETAGINSKQIRNLIHQVLPVVAKIPDMLPPEITRTVLARERFLHKNRSRLSKAEALRQIHFPSSTETLQQARDYLAFEELFVLILAGLVIKQEIKTETSPRIEFKEKLAVDFVKALPFKLTDGQRKAAWQILRDIDSEVPMNRLLEGDVGSGKTVVAALAATMAIANNYQVALMAPTEVLANQHLKTLLAIPALRSQVKLLSGSVTAKDRKDVAKRIAGGEIGLIVGTHALIQDAIRYKSLGLVVIDEQHRFGVKQRNQLKQKASKLPHLLAMSATPIPRSLALTVYGDLDISVIDELPGGRKAILTKVVTESQRQEVYKHIDGQIAAGRQVYVICPLISDSDTLGVKSVEAESERLKTGVFQKRKIGVLHGRMKHTEKQNMMNKFSRGEIDIIVSTTVVEVGVDIPNASVMLVEGAERFGLASLHQLRGRVGRGHHQSFCYVISSRDHQSLQRLQLLEQYNDGFTLAQKDLELRGPGELYGQRQHGLIDLRLAKLTDSKLIAAARNAAEAFIDKHDLLQYPELSTKVNRLKNLTSLD